MAIIKKFRIKSFKQKKTNFKTGKYFTVIWKKADPRKH